MPKYIPTNLIESQNESDGEKARSRELSLALTKLEEATMWANASIARGE